MIKRKWIIILLISKTEAFAMRKLVGEDKVKKTYTNNPHYYLVEDGHAIKVLKDYRKNHIVKSVK